MELFTHCRRCHTEHGGGDLCAVEFAQRHASASDPRLPGQISTRGYCEACKDAYYQHNRERIRLAYQQYLDSFLDPGYIYGLLQNDAITYIGRTHDVGRRIAEHKRTCKTFTGHRILATVRPGYLLAEMEARWICYGLQQGWSLTNKETQAAYEGVIQHIQENRDYDYFTCSLRDLACGDGITIRRIRSYERWVQEMPSELPSRFAVYSIE
jgi:hypothetical protein